ncbi:MAG TPA: SDR family NAD(P)-dependent oxidoreductase [Candidatus Paceibacterota bacterium]
MKGKIGLVTGASSGIGRAIALELAREGVEVIILGRNVIRLKEVAKEIELRGGKSLLVSVDVRDKENLRGKISKALDGRRLDTVICCAGVLRLGTIESLSTCDFKESMEVNFLGVVNTIQATLPYFHEDSRIGIINSAAGLIFLPGGFSAYSASKWALRGFLETIRQELSLKQIHLTVGYPSIIDTPMVRDLKGIPPKIYSIFPWKKPALFARRFLRDLRKNKKESYSSIGDRTIAFFVRLCPISFSRLLTLFVEGKS